MNDTRLDILFAHHDETLPAAFLDYATPSNKPLSALSERQLKKWKSRRMAHFLLHQLFETHHLDTSLLAHIQKTESGRPYLYHPQLDFNISHSGDWVAVILCYSSSKLAVGIDIEHPQKVRRYHDLLHYYAKPAEISALTEAKLPSALPEFEQRFYLSWCLREAVLKSQGVGIVKLSEVEHHPAEKTITTAYAPHGKLYFYHQLPFYLAYFFEQPQSVLLSPTLSQWREGQAHPLNALQPLIYSVNEGAVCQKLT